MVNKSQSSEKCKLKLQKNTSSYSSLAKMKKIFSMISKDVDRWELIYTIGMKEIGITTLEKQFGITY